MRGILPCIQQGGPLAAPQKSPEVGTGREEGAVAGASLWEVLVLWGFPVQGGEEAGGSGGTREIRFSFFSANTRCNKNNAVWSSLVA